jgi:hypothetical protein
MHIFLALDTAVDSGWFILTRTGLVFPRSVPRPGGGGAHLRDGLEGEVFGNFRFCLLHFYFNYFLNIYYIY